METKLARGRAFGLALSGSLLAMAALCGCQMGSADAGRSSTAINAPAQDAPGATGEALAHAGDLARGIPPCTVCHGRHGAGSAKAGFPRLAGQPAACLESAMRAWRSGERDSDPRRQMPAVARALAPGDDAAVAEYFSRLVAPDPVEAPAAEGAGELTAAR